MRAPKGKFRHLTAGEVMFSRMVFGEAIEYSRVKIYNKKWLPMQRDDVVMPPNGNIYYPIDLFKEDFSVVGLRDSDLHIFIHEMTHVWQCQNGYAVKFNGILSFRKSRYNYELSEGKKLSDYNMEAQANLIADYFLLIKFGERGIYYLSEEKSRSKGYYDLISQYQNVLADFILNPHDKRNLPGGGGRRSVKDDRQHRWGNHR